MEEIKKIDWNNISNNDIKHNLIELNYEHESLKNKLTQLSEKLEEVEKEYIAGSKILHNRLKGV